MFVLFHVYSVYELIFPLINDLISLSANITAEDEEWTSCIYWFIELCWL